MATVTREQKATEAWTKAMASAEDYAVDPYQHIARLVEAGEQMAALLAPKDSDALAPPPQPTTVTREQELVAAARQAFDTFTPGQCRWWRSAGDDCTCLKCVADRLVLVTAQRDALQSQLDCSAAALASPPAEDGMCSDCHTAGWCERAGCLAEQNASDARQRESVSMRLAPPVSDPPGLVEAVKRALPALMANRPPNGQVAYSQVREAIDLIRAAYDALPASPQAETMPACPLCSQGETSEACFSAGRHVAQVRAFPQAKEEK